MRHKQGQRFVIGNRLNDKFKDHIAKGDFDRDLDNSMSASLSAAEEAKKLKSAKSATKEDSPVSNGNQPAVSPRSKPKASAAPGEGKSLSAERAKR